MHTCFFGLFSCPVFLFAGLSCGGVGFGGIGDAGDFVMRRATRLGYVGLLGDWNGVFRARGEIVDTYVPYSSPFDVSGLSSGLLYLKETFGNVSE